MNFIKNKFLFIVLISIATLVVLVVGAISLYQDHSLVFSDNGYILETSTKKNRQYQFSANTKYKENVDNQIVFSDTKSNKVSVDPASFVHFDNGNMAFLQKGALVNLGDLNAPMVNYYNIRNDNVIVYDQGKYTVTSNGRRIQLDAFVGRISDKKYVVAGANVQLKIPQSSERISGEYFEIFFLEEGIVKIDNKDVSYQVTAQDSYIYVGDHIVINLGDGKILLDNDAKMLLSQITINGDENIDLDVPDNKKNGNGNNNGVGGDGSGSSEEDPGLDGDGTGTGNGDGTGNGNGEVGDRTTDSPQIELIEAVVTSTSVDLSMQLNNANLARGSIVAYFTNVATGQRSEGKTISLANGTFTLSYESLVPNTEYALSIIEIGIDQEKQYFQKTFRTKDLGLSLERVYATEDSLSYRVIFDENTDVTRARVTIYENSDGTNTSIQPNEFTVLREDIDGTVVFTGLKSNTNYAVSIETVWIDNAAYNDLYSINRIDSTLKKKPSLSGIKVTPNAEEVKFNIELNNVKDPDSSIISYIYKIYLADDITVDNMNPNVIYSVTKNDHDALVLNLNEIDELKTGVNYRCRIVAQYHDNEMIREVSTDYSGNFLIKSKPNINFELESATMNRIVGTIHLVDANCTVPLAGRVCSNLRNNFTLRYYKLKDAETTENDTSITFDASSLSSHIELSDLSSNTTYAVKVFGNYYDDDNVIHTNVQIGDTFYVTTDKSDNLHLEIVGDNISGKNKDGSDNSANVVTFDARLTAPQDSTIMEEISTITLNLYSGRYNVADKLIGTYKMNTKSEIEDFFSNITIRNSMFTDVTNRALGPIDSLEKMILLTNNSTQSLNAAYTVEVEDVYDSTGSNKITVEDNVYTFNLTPAYYLDTRIETNKDSTFVTVTPIKKENLTEEEYEKLLKTVKNLDDLNNDTIVGMMIENSLSDTFVDSAFTYEKAVVNYKIYNSTTKKEIQMIPMDMGNKYQPKQMVVYLDPSELDDGSHFTRGYNYRIGFDIAFVTEDGSNPTYTNEALYKNVAIERQAPLYSQYVKTSDENGITYRFRFNDIDHALYDKNIYYSLGDDSTILNVSNVFQADNTYHDVTIPLGDRGNYRLYYGRKSTSNTIDYVQVVDYHFDREYSYNNQLSYTIVNDHDNVLKLRFDHNDITDRSYVYKVVIKAKNNSSISDYTRYFLTSQLETVSVPSGTYDEEGNEILNSYPYIAIDYANISKFMGSEMLIYVYCYYDSGLIGIEQPFRNGFILEDTINKKYLNIYNGGSSKTSFSRIDLANMGLYLPRENYNKEDSTIYLYNQLMDTDQYNPKIGASYYNTKDLASNIGIKFDVTFSNAGLVLSHDRNSYLGIQMRALKEADLKTNDNRYLFNAITPTIEVKDGVNTINSVTIKMNPSGIYGNRQFMKDGQIHQKVYVELYDDEGYTNRIDTKVTDIHVLGDDLSGYSATIDDVICSDLDPATTYYFRVFAYIDGEYKRLYDHSSTTSYITKDYDISTLDAKGILSSIQFSVLPKSYQGESSLKELTWRLGLKNTSNYRLRFELFALDGTTRTEIDPITGENVEVPNYKAVNFDGSQASLCDMNQEGNASDGYVNGCYISVLKEHVNGINNQNVSYAFSGNHFLFGDGHYKLVVYAIPYTKGKYVEEAKLIIYQNDQMMNGDITSNGLRQVIHIPFLEEVNASLGDTLSAGYTDANGYYVSFSPTIVDKHKIIKYGKYHIHLKDEKGNIVETSSGEDKCLYYLNKENDPVVKKSDTCSITLNADSINQKVEFLGLRSNTLYYVELTYEVYRNNVGFTEEQKMSSTPFTDFIYTPIAAGITLGTITATQQGARGVVLTYNGSANLSENIVEVVYTISLKGGSSKTTGSYQGEGIFTINSDKTPRLTIDTSDTLHSDNSSFVFRSGNTYIISTKYYYMANGQKTLLKDQETGNDTFTTILNL